MKSPVSSSLNGAPADQPRRALLQHIDLQLAALGQPTCAPEDDQDHLTIAGGLLRNYTHHRQLLADYRCPADQRIQAFLDTYLRENGIELDIELPRESFVLDKAGLARELSLPLNGHHFRSRYLESYRVLQGVLHNPRSDRRTTSGVFHIAEGGLPIPAGKRAVPAIAFARLLQKALAPPEDLLQLPITSDQPQQARLWVSLLLRPLVCPEIPGEAPAKRMETRMFAPGGLVANLDFVETIFGNGGNPHLPENDAGLDIAHWTGHTGCIILAPHLVGLPKRDLGLPHIDQATPAQRRDGMCWQHEEEPYNDGQAFKIVCRDLRGVIVTVIADNYFGYSKKEIKSQISYAANLYGGCEEEHAGGALAFARYNLGESFRLRDVTDAPQPDFEAVCHLLGDRVEPQAEGYGIDRRFPRLIYLPRDAAIDLNEQRIRWRTEAGEQIIKLLLNHTYIYPSGYKVHMERHPHAPTWRLIGTVAEGAFCHKPSTVSGGGKSEISKSIAGAVISGPVYVGDFEEDLDQVTAIFERDYSQRFRDPGRNGSDRRPVLSPQRSLGSVIKLLTPSPEDYSGAYNQWLEGLPQHILALVFLIKRFYRPEWGKDWRRHFSVDRVNGYPGHELKFGGRRLVASYLRVGFERGEAWRIHKLRQDFIPAEKVQMEDDISVSATLPAAALDCLATSDGGSVKIVENCEAHLFQRPDDAINRGRDTQTEADLADGNNFISNFEPLSSDFAREIVDDAIHFYEYSKPMRRLIRRAATAREALYFVSSAHPRLVDGRPSPNVRYLQRRPDHAEPQGRYLAEIGTRLARAIPDGHPLCFAVDAVLSGRRNNPPQIEQGIRPLAVYNPIHYQELPELFMDLICSLTGKSPSTTGAGSEGALTKGPFNALSPTADLNNALVAFILCGHAGFTTPAGHIGAEHRIDHDISMLVPEIWCRLSPAERDPQCMIAQGHLEKLSDFEHEGRSVPASRLGYRITDRFVHDYFGRVFDNPRAVFDAAMLRPELQDPDAFADGVLNIVEAQQRVAQGYLDDGSLEDACPPLQALLHIMAHGHYQGRSLEDEAIRALFSREYLLASAWYRDRLALKQRREQTLWERHRAYLQERLMAEGLDDGVRSELARRLEQTTDRLQWLAREDYRQSLWGSLGADWIHRPVAGLAVPDA